MIENSHYDNILKHGNFRSVKISQKSLLKFSCGGYFHDINEIFYTNDQNTGDMISKFLFSYIDDGLTIPHQIEKYEINP